MRTIKVFIISLFFLSSLMSLDIVEKALSFSLLPTNTIHHEKISLIHDQVFDCVEACDYEKALTILLEGLEEFPHSFCLQSFFAALVGDHSENLAGIEKIRMEEKSKEMFNKLMNEVEDQEIEDIYVFKNEYFFRFALHKEQYENGKEMVDHYYNNIDNFESRCIGKGYYYQGVGAAHYAQQLLIDGQKELALEYAQRSLVAWAQHFSYKNDYYNSYVHYALALGILNYREEMLKALEHSARLINRDLTYHEFVEVINFFSV